MNSLVRSLYDHRWLIGLVAFYVAATKLLGLWLGFPVLLNVYDPATARFAYLVPAIYALARASFVAVIRRPDRPLQLLWREGLQWASLERILGLAICVLILPPFLSAFTSLKSAIPALNPFSWDETFFHLDRMLHGGTDPWRILQPILGHAPITAAIAACYHTWYFVVYLSVMAVCWSTRDQPVRMQFLISFALCWILLGNIAAIVFSSAGPCYFGSVTGKPDPYAALMAYLDSVDALSRVPQKALWVTYQAGRIVRRSGISAMPSMHVAMVTLLALAGWRAGRVAGLLATLYAGIVMIGSVHLAWHYAVDGYVSAAGTVAIWHFVGWCQRRGSPSARLAGPVVASTLAGAAPGDGAGEGRA